MSSPFDSQVFESYVPVYDAIPEKWEDARPFMVEVFKKISNAVNIREIGWFLDQELLSGKQFTPGTSSSNDQQFRTVFRTVVNFGALPNTASKSVAHNFTNDANFTLVEMFISATDPVAFHSFSLQYWAKSVTEEIKIDIEGPNIVVTTTADYSNYTRSNVIIEYIQEL